MLSETPDGPLFVDNRPRYTAFTVTATFFSLSVDVIVYSRFPQSRCLAPTTVGARPSISRFGLSLSAAAAARAPGVGSPATTAVFSDCDTEGAKAIMVIYWRLVAAEKTKSTIRLSRLGRYSADRDLDSLMLSSQSRRPDEVAAVAAVIRWVSDQRPTPTPRPRLAYQST